MKNYKVLFLLLISFLVSSPKAYSDQIEAEDNGSPLGFDFGISKKEAIRKIESEGKTILENDVDSKEIRTIIVEGVLIDLPIDVDDSNIQTRLEFFDDKLMSTSLIIRPDDHSSIGDAAGLLYAYLAENYGDPYHKEKILNFITWTWLQPEVKVVYTTSRNSNELKIAYTYEPMNRKRLEKELQEKRKVKPEDPATEMFLEGDYSKPAHLKE